MITWGVRVRIPPAKRDEVRSIFRGLLEPTRVLGGCLSCRVYQDVEDPNALVLMQEWVSSEDLQRYLRSEDRRALIGVMELATEPPDVWFDTIESREGLDRLAQLMGCDAGRPSR